MKQFNSYQKAYAFLCTCPLLDQQAAGNVLFINGTLQKGAEAVNYVRTNAVAMVLCKGNIVAYLVLYKREQSKSFFVKLTVATEKLSDGVLSAK